MKLIAHTAALASMVFIVIIVLAGCAGYTRGQSDTHNRICSDLKDKNLCR